MRRLWIRLWRDKLALGFLAAAVACTGMAWKEYADAQESKRQNIAYLQEDLAPAAAPPWYETAPSAISTVVEAVYSPPKPSGIVPAAIEIPAIKLMPSEVIRVGVLSNGEMGVPDDWHKAGWFEAGYKPGEPGNSVISGHVDNREGLGIFFLLKSLKEGDKVYVTDEAGKSLTFSVKKLEAYLPEEAPMEQIFGESPVPRLNLITCTGTFDAKLLSYDKRLVVYTELDP